MDGQAVKECLEHLIQVHSRARSDLMIRSIEADGADRDHPDKRAKAGPVKLSERSLRMHH